jgi:hypothetical protein
MDDPTTSTPTQPSSAADPGDTAATSATAMSATAADDGGRTADSREWLAQLQSMIDNLATHAAPVMREIGAKAAELAAAAGEKAGPIAQKAAEVTAQAGVKVAERGREVAAELRRDQARDDAASADPTGTTTIPTSTGVTADDRVDPLGQ